MQVTITKPNVYSQFGIPLAINTEVTVSDQYGKWLIECGLASDTYDTLKGNYVAVSRDLMPFDDGKTLVCAAGITLNADLSKLPSNFGIAARSPTGQVAFTVSNGVLINKDGNTKSAGANAKVSLTRSSVSTIDLDGTTGA